MSITTILRQNKVLLLISLTELFLSFSYFGILDTLILFFVNHAGFSEKLSYNILGNFSSLVYLSALIGGVFGGMFMTFRSTCIIGLFLVLIGFLFLTMDQQISSINIGLTFVGVGN